MIFKEFNKYNINMQRKKIIEKLFQYIISNKKELSKFFLVGILSTFINYITYIFIYKLSSIIVLASFSGYSFGLIISYLLSRYWTFSIKNNSKNFIMPFLFIHFSGLIAGVSLIYLVDKLIDNYLIAWFVGALFVAPYNYIGLKKFAFK